MDMLKKLMERIVGRVNMNLREFEFDVGPYITDTIPLNQMIKFNTFYGITSHHPLRFTFKHSNMAGSYFLGKCKTDHAILYKTDIRGDELKRKGDIFKAYGMGVPVENDEIIFIKDSYLIRTLVHSNSHNPETPEQFLIRNTVACHCANIHGSTLMGCFLGAFSTVDLTALHSCMIGHFSYIQTGELFHHFVPPGTIWVKADDFEFKYQFDEDILEKYVHEEPGKRPGGIIMDFVEERKKDYDPVFESTSYKHQVEVPESSSLNRYAFVKGKTVIDKNVLISQRAYLDNAIIGPGANVQENGYIVNSHLQGNDVTAHGGKIINSNLGNKVFVGFNAFIRGIEDSPLKVGDGCIIMPHTIIDLEEPLEIPAGKAVWGYIRNAADLKENSITMSTLEKFNGERTLGGMHFKGCGATLVNGFKDRIDHILEANGAMYDKNIPNTAGHAQEGQTISFNSIQPYLTGEQKGIYPTIDILP